LSAVSIGIGGMVGGGGLAVTALTIGKMLDGALPVDPFTLNCGGQRFGATLPRCQAEDHLATDLLSADSLFALLQRKRDLVLGEMVASSLHLTTRQASDPS